MEENINLKTQTAIFVFQSDEKINYIFTYKKTSEIVYTPPMPDGPTMVTVWDSANYRTVFSGDVVSAHIDGWGALLDHVPDIGFSSFDPGAQAYEMDIVGPIKQEVHIGKESIIVLGSYPLYNTNIDTEEANKKATKIRELNRGYGWYEADNQQFLEDLKYEPNDHFILNKTLFDKMTIFYNDAVSLVNTGQYSSQLVQTELGDFLILYKNVITPHIFQIVFSNLYIVYKANLYILPEKEHRFYKFISNCQDALNSEKVIQYKIDNRSGIYEKGGTLIRDLVTMKVITDGYEQIEKIKNCDYKDNQGMRFVVDEVKYDVTNERELTKLKNGYVKYDNILGFFPCNLRDKNPSLKEVLNNVEIKDDLTQYMQSYFTFSIPKFNHCKVNYSIENLKKEKMSDIYLEKNNSIDNYKIIIDTNCKVEKHLAFPVCLLAGTKVATYADSVVLDEKYYFTQINAVQIVLPDEVKIEDYAKDL